MPTPTSYLDFEIEIGLGDGHTYPVAVLRSPAGEAKAELTWPFSQLQLENRLLALQNALLRSGGSRRSILTQEEQTVQDFGADLFNAIFVAEVRSLYDVSRQEASNKLAGLRIKLRLLAPDLAVIPWEFLYDPRKHEFLSLSSESPLVRYVDLPRPISPLNVRPPLRILAMAVNPTGMTSLDVAVERQRMEHGLADLIVKGLIELVWLEGQTWQDLRQAIRQGIWHIFHFVGHGGFDALSGEGTVILADRFGLPQACTSTQLARLLGGHRTLRLAVFNSCEGAKADRRDVFSSTAATLVRTGIPAVLAMQYAITDAAAMQFAESFYDALAEGSPIDAAVVEARIAISMAVNNSLEWGTPVLYLRSNDGRIFDIDASDASSKKSVDLSELRPSHSSVADLASSPAPELNPRTIGKLRFSFPPYLSRLAAFSRFSSLRPLLKLFSSWPRQRWIALATILAVLVMLLTAAFWPRPSQSVPNPTATPDLLLSWPTQLPAIVSVSVTDTPTSIPTDIPTSEPTSIPAPITVITRVNSVDGAVYVFVPEGEFTMGSDSGISYEGPAHAVYLDAFWIMRTEVTNAQYGLCVAAGWCIPPENSRWNDSVYAQHPVVNVNWQQSVDYATWAGGGLPTEAQWEKACRDGDQRVYPWGSAMPAMVLSNFNAGIGDTNAVGSHPRGVSPYGSEDMAGNVLEWTVNWYESYDSSPISNPTGPTNRPENAEYRIMRGGSFSDDSDNVRCAYRGVATPDVRFAQIGFRVASSDN